MFVCMYAYQGIQVPVDYEALWLWLLWVATQGRSFADRRGTNTFFYFLSASSKRLHNASPDSRSPDFSGTAFVTEL